MSDITRNGNMEMEAETGTAQEGDSALTDLVMEGLDIQLSPSIRGESEGTANARAMAYRDRILEVAGRSKETS
ncbi:MAG: hypothetical protein II008_10100, partial [Oscillospiraceae bacterium]|nr:hypothetical protein [Oscillospiraceae bacterium]